MVRAQRPLDPQHRDRLHRRRCESVTLKGLNEIIQQAAPVQAEEPAAPRIVCAPRADVPAIAAPYADLAEANGWTVSHTTGETPDGRKVFMLDAIDGDRSVTAMWISDPSGDCWTPHSDATSHAHFADALTSAPVQADKPAAPLPTADAAAEAPVDEPAVEAEEPAGGPATTRIAAAWAKGLFMLDLVARCTWQYTARGELYTITRTSPGRYDLRHATSSGLYRLATDCPRLYDVAQIAKDHASELQAARG